MVSYELIKWLALDAGLVALLADAEAFHPDQLPERAGFPCLVIENERGGQKTKNYGGLSNARTPTRITIKVWAATVPARENTVTYLVEKMNGYTGPVAGLTRATLVASVIARAQDGERNKRYAIIDLTITNRS